MKRGLKRQHVQLKDGRTLSYIVDRPSSSDDTMPTVFYFHGMYSKGSDFVRNKPPESCVGVYVDRPGYGESDPVPDVSTWSYGKFAEDIEELANHLKVEKFYVLGHSSGGPCALACGSYLPERVVGIADIAGDPEYARQGAPKETFGTILALKCYVPTLLCLFSLGGMCGVTAQRSTGSVADYAAERKPYDFRIESIQQPTLLVTGSRDTWIPSSFVEFNHQQLPSSEIMTVTDATHLSIISGKNLKKIISKMMSMVESRESGK